LQLRDSFALSGWDALNGWFMLARTDPPHRSLKARFAHTWRLTGLLFGVAITLAWMAFLGYEALWLVARVL